MEPKIRVFISSKQSEFATERAVLAHEIRSIPLLEPVLAEEWNPTGTNVHDVYLNDVRTSPIYVGLFGGIYSEPTYREYAAACENPYREKLLYVKKCESVDEKLQELLKRFNDLHVPARFVSIADLLPAFSRHLMAALSRMITLLQMLGQKAPTTQGMGGAMEKRWARQMQQIVELGIPADMETRRQILMRLEDSVSQIRQRG